MGRYLNVYIRVVLGCQTGTMEEEFDLALINTFFEKKLSQFVTYKSKIRESQIDFLMCRRRILKEEKRYVRSSVVGLNRVLLVID